MLSRRSTRSVSMSESVQLGVGVGEIPHLPNHALGLLRNHGETARLRVEAASPEANELQTHRPEQLATVVELLLRILLLARDLRQGATLAAQHGETAHAVFAGAIVERVGLRFQSADLLLDPLGGFAPGATIEIRQRQRELLDFAEQLVGGSRHFRDLIAVIRRHVEQLAMYLAMIALCLTDRRTVARIGERRRRTSGNRAQAGRRTSDPRVRLKRLHRRHRRNRREHPLSACPRSAPDLFALLFVEQRACVVDRLSGNIEEESVTALTKNVPPVVTRGPELRISECQEHCPHNGERDEVVIREEGDRNQDRIHREIRGELATERDYLARVPPCPLVGGRFGRRVSRLTSSPKTTVRRITNGLIRVFADRLRNRLTEVSWLLARRGWSRRASSQRRHRSAAQRDRGRGE